MTLTYEATFVNGVDQLAHIEYGSVQHSWNDDRRDSLPANDRNHAKMLITGVGSEIAEGTFIISYAGQPIFEVKMTFMFETFPTFQSRKFDTLSPFKLEQLNPVSVTGSRASVLFRVSSDETQKPSKYKCKFLNKTDEVAELKYETDVHLKWNEDKPSSVPEDGQADLLITGDLEKASGEIIIAYAKQSFVVVMSYESGSQPTFSYTEFGPESSDGYQLKLVSPASVTGTSAAVEFEVLPLDVAVSYECKFLNKTGESAGLQYATDVHLKWNADKPSSVPENGQTDLLITGDSELAKGEFVIVYGNQLFLVTLCYQSGLKPTILSQKFESGQSTTYQLKIIREVSVEGIRAKVEFEVAQLFK